MTNKPTVAIIFPNYNGADLSCKCLNAINNLSYPRDKVEIIVVDNGSTDGSIHKIKSQFPNVKLIKNSKNLGFAKAINQAVKTSNCKIIFVTNNDVIIDRNCLFQLTNYLQKHKNVGVVGPKVLLLKKGNIVDHTALKFNFTTGLFQKLITNHDQPSDWIEGSGMCFKKDLFNKIGSFDEGFFFTYEDLDFCLRAKKHGYQVICHPQAIITHHAGSTINRESMLYFKYFEGYKSKIRLILKHANVFQMISSLLLQFLIYAPYRKIILREKSTTPLIKATLWNVKNLKKTLKSRSAL